MDLATARDFQLMAEESDLSKEKTPPWLHEIKHDGFRVIARQNGNRVKPDSRRGNDLTNRFSLIVEALAGLRARSCIIDGEAVACGDDGIALLDRLRYRPHEGSALT